MLLKRIMDDFFFSKVLGGGICNGVEKVKHAME